MKFSKYNIIMNKNNEEYYLFNSFHGSIYSIGKDIKHQIEEKNINYFDSNKLEEYKKAGIVVEDNVNEDNLYSYLYNNQKFTNKALGLTILLTYDCNLRCVYCYEGAGELNKGSLTDEVRESIYNFVVKQVEARDSKVVSMVLFGGEPLLNFRSNVEWLDKVKKYCDDNNKIFMTTLITNGILIDNYIMDKLIDYNCNAIQITLDGIKEIHDKRRIYVNKKGSFDEVINGIKLIHNNPKLNNPIIRINVDKTNISQTEEILQYLAENNLNDCFVDFGIVKSTTKACSSYASNCFTDEELGDVLEQLWDKLDKYNFKYNVDASRKIMYCGLYSDSSFTISPNGELYKCWDHVGYDEHLMGKITKDGNIDNLTPAYFDWMSHNPINVRECRECSYLPACGGGCGAISYGKSKTYSSSGCFKTKGVLEKQIIRFTKKLMSSN